jgi:flagellar assembly factor FliW
MLVTTNRFGPLEVPEDKLLTMARPILGFEGLTRFCIIEVEELLPFLWLQSIENQAAAFLVVNPAVFFPDYRIEVNPKEIAELKVGAVASVETYVIVTIPNEPRDVSVNLQGPILINTENNLAKQLVLVNSTYQVSHRLLDALERRRQRPERRRAEYAV